MMCRGWGKDMETVTITVKAQDNTCVIDGKTYKLVEETPERPQKNPKIYKPKEIMEHLLKGGWIEMREYSNASYYKYLNNDGYFVSIFKRDDERACETENPYEHGLGLTHFELEYRKYFLIKPLTDNELRTLGRQGVDV